MELTLFGVFDTVNFENTLQIPFLVIDCLATIYTNIIKKECKFICVFEVILKTTPTDLDDSFIVEKLFFSSGGHKWWFVKTSRLYEGIKRVDIYFSDMKIKTF